MVHLIRLNMKFVLITSVSNQCPSVILQIMKILVKIRFYVG